MRRGDLAEVHPERTPPAGRSSGGLEPTTRGYDVSHDDLICASCSGRVADGRCPVCREARAQMRESARTTSLVYLAIAAVILFAFVFALVRGLH
ncbi:MAG TPA: hypothetical protein VF053_05095 [Streptosporangiales bacterium]